MPLSPSNRGCVHKPARKVCDISRIKVLHVLHTVMSAADASVAATSASASASAASTSMSGSSIADGAAADACSSASASASASTAVSPLDCANDFYSTGRVGRRNALPNILSQQHAHISTADLPDQLMAMSTRDRSVEAGGSGSDGAAASSSQSSSGEAGSSSSSQS